MQGAKEEIKTPQVAPAEVRGKVKGEAGVLDKGESLSKEIIVGI